jgi:hypothetical protein
VLDKVQFEVTAGVIVIEFSSVCVDNSAQFVCVTVPMCMDNRAQFVCVTVPNHCPTSLYKFGVPEGSKCLVCFL